MLLSDISFSIKKGEIITFFGEIGCGKSTLLNILQRFHPFESGKVKVNSECWENIGTQEWRSNIASVSQHVQLFNGTVLENICLAENPELENVMEFCMSYGFHDFIMEFQQAYLTIVNENGANLSGGQQQLIALARALYSKPKLLLLDEATAAMGCVTEKIVIDLLNDIKSEMAIVFVTHRPQLARYTDRIYTIENRTITACGTHSQLINNNKIYREAFEYSH